MQGTGVSSKENHTPKARFSKAKKLTQRAGRRGGGSSLGVGTSTAVQTGLNAFGLENRELFRYFTTQGELCRDLQNSLSFPQSSHALPGKTGLALQLHTSGTRAGRAGRDRGAERLLQGSRGATSSSGFEQPRLLRVSEGRQVATAEVPREVAVLVRGEAERTEQMLG